jgi:nicotinate-nucleotide--dimethylbenzimidazole phosphoribosyltransferase
MTAPDKPTPLEVQLRAKLAGKAKPVGSLGRLEDLAVQIGLLTGSQTPDLGGQRLVVFVGDHGITAEGVAAYPSSVTREIAQLVLARRAGANVTASVSGTTVLVVDAGLLVALDEQPGLISKRIGAGTKNARREAAMSVSDYQRAFDAGQDVVRTLLAEGVGIFALGEIGIGNSSAATLLAHAATDIAFANLIGPGAGLPPKGLDHKRTVLIETYARAYKGQIDCEPRRAFAEFAGFEMVMMAGAISAVAKARKIAIIDGFIATSVAAALFAIDPKARDSCVFAHVSGEPGHKALLAWLKATPLLDLGLRLGEGTGAALAIPLVRAAEGVLSRLADLPSVHAPPAARPPA